MSTSSPIPPVHVVSVTYKIVSDSPGHDFSKVEAFDGSLDGWTFHIEAGVLTAKPVHTFGTREGARADIEPRLAEWSQAAFLAERLPFHFEYESSQVEVIDPDPRNVFVFPDAATVTVSAGTPTVILGHRRFPEADGDFSRTVLTDLLTERLRALEEGRAELPAIAYLVATVLEGAFGGQTGAQANLAVSNKVFSTLNRLSSQYDPLIGRKASTPNPVPLADKELAWLRATIFRLAHRVGEHAAGGPLAQITLADLPPLT